MTSHDYYQTLGVEHNADAKTIKNAYRELAFKNHPDRNNDQTDSAEMMKRINEAYAVLSNPEKRRDYDTIRNRFGDNAYGQFRSTYSEKEIFKDSDVQQIFEEMARSFGLRGLDSLFNDLSGSGAHRTAFKPHGFHVRGFVFQGRFGKRRGKAMAGSAPPVVSRLARYLFQKVSGINLPQAGEDIHDTIWLSPEFARSGGPFPYHHQRRSKKLVVNIPAGTRPGQQIRLSQMGSDGRNGGKTGDLYLKVRVKQPFLDRAKEFIVSRFGR